MVVNDQPRAMNRSLLDMPIEILIEIIREISLNDIKAVIRLAMTSKESLQIVEAAEGCTLKESRSLERRFGKANFENKVLGRVIAERDDLKEQFPHVTETNPVPDLSYLHLKGYLTWLRPLDRETKGQRSAYLLDSPIQPHDLDKLIRRAKALRLKLPHISFVKIMRNRELQDRMPFKGDHFRVGNSFVRCPPKVDRNAGGYILRFLYLGHQSRYMNLYLDTMGQHCVFSTACVSDPFYYGGEREESSEAVENIVMETQSFEEYLYHHWINGLATIQLSILRRGLSEAQRVYLEHMPRPVTSVLDPVEEKDNTASL